MRPTSFPWAIVLARFSDRPAETRPAEYYRDLYTRGGTGGAVDYWRDVTLGNLDLTGSQVFGWLTMTRSTADLAALTFPRDRSTLVTWGREAAAAAGVDLGPFRNVLVVQNAGSDHGAAGNGILIVHSDPQLCEFGFICHEMGHGHGLGHSWSAAPDTEYGDGFDIMSFATSTAQFRYSFNGSSGDASVGLSAPGLMALGAMEPRRLWSPARPDFSETLVLDALNQPQVGNGGGPLVASVPPGATRPARSDGSTWTVEFRRRAGWDRGLARDAVVVHQVRTNGRSYLRPGRGSSFVAGQDFASEDPKVFGRVVSIAGSPTLATIRLWDLPEGSLRKEDSNPRVYLVQNGTKRWVTSPGVLFALGRGWGDVRSVPDGALSVLPDGPDISLVTTSVAPRPVPVNRSTTLTVTARDAGTGAPVAGRVLVGGVDQGPTNTALTLTVRTTRRVISVRPREVEILYPRVTVRAPGYPEALVDCGWPDA